MHNSCRLAVDDESGHPTCMAARLLASAASAHAWREGGCNSVFSAASKPWLTPVDPAVACADGAGALQHNTGWVHSIGTAPCRVCTHSMSPEQTPSAVSRALASCRIVCAAAGLHYESSFDIRMLCTLKDSEGLYTQRGLCHVCTCKPHFLVKRQN